ncbi:MAG TPA: EAL domain-containing protein [Planctomycetota bacterium]|nr:EAL domain-containing protein [Planctomycetota bacterium]
METRRLLMLDSDGAVERISEAVRDAGYRCDAVDTEAAFRRRYALGSPAVIVLVIDPGDETGAGVLRFLAEQMCHLPVVLVTGFDATVLQAIGHLSRLRGLRIVSVIGKAEAPECVRRVVQSVESCAAVGVRGEIQEALARGEILPHYQPIFDLRTLAPIGVEALMRWEHGFLGLLPACDFARSADDAGVFDEIGWSVIERALLEFFAPAHQGCTQFLSLNASPRQVTERGFAERLLDAIRSAGGDPARVTLEVTESSSMENPAQALALFGRLRSAGVRLALDDFGKGYSSLSLLQRMPFDVLKLDQDFMRKAPRSRDTRVILTTLVGLGTSLGLSVVAEGIESQACLDLARKLGVTLGQGFHLGKPVPREGLEALLGRPRRTGARKARSTLAGTRGRPRRS